ncbi:MAG: TolC family protein [Pirellulaceae bacterium]|nr:TolC family protein [Pirellulaceae bacterium]
MTEKRQRWRLILRAAAIGISLQSLTPCCAQDDRQSVHLRPASQSNSANIPNVADGSAVAQPTAPSNFEWWTSSATHTLRHNASVVDVDVDSLIYDALACSAKIQAIHENVAISETGIASARAGFDPRLFMESKFNRLNVPTGSSLDAGFNVDRLIENNWYYNGGLRRRNYQGGKWELAQKYGTRDSNSQFFFPPDQGNARLSLGYTQPLLNGAGGAYNRSLIVLATLDNKISSDSFIVELQDYLLTVFETHWELYRQRTWMLQKRINLERAQDILKHLEQRRQFDAYESQIAQVQAAVTTRIAELVQAETAIRNAESRLRAMVNSPALLSNRESELVPSESPTRHAFLVATPDALVTAMECRAEVDQAFRELEAGSVRLNIAKNELLPVLDVVLESYVSGLRGNYDVGQSWVDQFSVGGPSYTAGLIYEVPLGRRAGKAQLQRREAECRQLVNQFRALTENIAADVEIAVRNVDTAYRVMNAKEQSLVAANANAHYFHRRWDLLPGDDRAATFLLQDLLDAQDRLLSAEDAYVQSQVGYVMSLARFKRATGQLLQCESINP